MFSAKKVKQYLIMKNKREIISSSIQWHVHTHTHYIQSTNSSNYLYTCIYTYEIILGLLFQNQLKGKLKYLTSKGKPETV